MRDWLDQGGDDAVLDANRDLARRQFSLEAMTAAIAELLTSAGWLP